MMIKVIIILILDVLLISCCGSMNYVDKNPPDPSNPVLYASRYILNQNQAGKYIYRNILVKYPPGSSKVKFEQYLKSLGGKCGDAVTAHDHKTLRICNFIGDQILRLPDCEYTHNSIDWYIVILEKNNDYYDVDLLLGIVDLNYYLENRKTTFDFKN